MNRAAIMTDLTPHFKQNLRELLENLVGECIQNGILFKDAVEQVEMEYIMQTLGEHRYNISRCAQVLGINRNTLSKRIERFQEYERFRQHQALHSTR